MLHIVLLVVLNLYAVIAIGWSYELIRFLLDSKTLGVYYMPSDRFTRINRYVIVCGVLYALTVSLSSFSVSTTGFIIVMVVFFSVGRLVGIMRVLNKEQRWLQKQHSPVGFLVAFTLAVVSLTVHMIVTAITLFF